MTRSKAILLTMMMAVSMLFAGLSIYYKGIKVIDYIVIIGDIAIVAYIWKLYKKGGKQ